MDPTPPGGNPQGAKEAAAHGDASNQSSNQQAVQQVFGLDLDLGSTVMIAVMLLLGLLQREHRPLGLTCLLLATNATAHSLL